MSNPSNEMPEVVIPKCPHCGEELAALMAYAWQLPGWTILSASCPACRKLLKMSFAPAMPQDQPSPEPPRIARPS